LGKDELEPPYVGCYETDEIFQLRPLKAEESGTGVGRLSYDDLSGVSHRLRSGRGPGSGGTQVCSRVKRETIRIRRWPTQYKIST
jgi:hypothetical protein